MNWVLLKSDLKRVPKLLLGYIFLSLGIVLTLISHKGMDPWGIFHEGLYETLSIDLNIAWITFGRIIQITGLLILLLSIAALRTKVGIGTILNVVVVGWVIDLFKVILPTGFENHIISYVILIIGLIVMTFGRTLYISADLGSGPRDGLFVGFTRVTGIPVKYGKPGIEMVILYIGYILGGTVGVGTLILIFASGYIADFFFKILGFDPKQKRQSDIIEYFQKQKVSNESY